MSTHDQIERVGTLVIGGGQAGLAVAHHLSRRNLPFLIVDANDRIGDPWRERWDSLRLFTPACFDALPGMPFPAPGHTYPTKDEMADYLEAYAEHFEFPIFSGTRVERLSRIGDRFVAVAGDRRFEAENVVVAMSDYQEPKPPAFAHELAPEIVQLHSAEYRNPSQLEDGPVLLVGAANSGSEIGMEVVRSHRTLMSGPDVGHIPFRIEGFLGRLFLVRLVLRVIFHRVLSVSNPIGRSLRGKKMSQAAPLVRVKPKDMERAGIERVPRTVGIRNGRPLLEDGNVVDVANVIWCTGFHGGFDWIDLPVLENGKPVHDRGIVPDEPGLYFVGLHFLYALSSAMVHAVGRDADRIAGAIEERVRSSRARLRVAV